MPFPINNQHRLLLENGDFLLLEDGTSKLILDERIALDDPLNAATVADSTPTLTFVGVEAAGGELQYEAQVDTVSTFDSTVSSYGESAISDSYSEANQSVERGNGANASVGQSFTGDGKYLLQVDVYIKGGSLATGNMNAKLYAHSGTFGTSSVGTGVALATSDNLAEPTDSSFALRTFTFSGANIVKLTNATNYVIAVQTNDNRMAFGTDNTSPSHAGNLATRTSGGTWAAVSTEDLCFYVYTADPVLGPLLDKTSSIDVGFYDETSASRGDDFLLLETGDKLLLEDNSSRLIINYNYPSGDYASYTVQSALADNTYYWRVRERIKPNGTWSEWSEIRSFALTSIQNVSITQIAASVTASGSTQVVTAQISTSVSQVAANVTATGGTQSIATVNNVSISQLAANVTASAGTQVVNAIVIASATVTQVAVTTRENVTMGSGVVLGDGSLLLSNGKLYALTNTSPAKLVCWNNPDDLTTYSTTTFPADNAHNNPQHMIYDAGSNRIYIGFQTSIADDTTTVTSVDPANIASYVDLIQEVLPAGITVYAPTAITCDGTYLYVGTKSTAEASWLFKYNMSGVYQSSVQLSNANQRRLHGLANDGTRLYVSGTRTGPTQGWVGWVELDFSAQAYYSTGTGVVMNDELILIGSNMWIGDEATTLQPNGTVRVIAKDLSTDTSVNTGVAFGIDGVMYDGTYVWTGVLSNPGTIVAIDPVTKTAIKSITLQSGEIHVNEILRWNTSLILITTESPSHVIRQPFASVVSATGGIQSVSATVMVNASIAQLAANVTATGGTQVITAAASENVNITQVAGVVTATGGTQTVDTSNYSEIAQLAGNVIASGGTQLVQTNSSNTQIAATVTVTGGTQTVDTVNIVSLAQLAGNVIATGGTQVIDTVNNVTISQLAATVTATGGTQVIDTVNSVAITQVAANVTAAGGTQSIGSVVNSSITQLAATVTATGGTQAVASDQYVAITQSAASVTASGGTQVIQSLANVIQLAANVTAAGGTQVVTSVNNVAISQLAASVTATGGTQSIATVNNVSIAQLAGNVTASGGTQSIDTVNIVSISQVASNVTASGGVQVLTSTVSVTQSAANVTATGGLQAIASSQFVSISQLAGSVTATGGTQTIDTVNNVAIAQLAANVTASGGTQSLGSVINSSVSQVAANVTATGGTQIVDAYQIASITQIAASVTAAGGSQVVAAIQLATITQLAGTVTAAGGTQVINTVNNSTISQIAGSVTATGGTQAIATTNNTSIAQLAANVIAFGGTQSVGSIINTSVIQVNASVIAAGGTQTLSSQIDALIDQRAADVIASGGLQTITTPGTVSGTIKVWNGSAWIDRPVKVYDGGWTQKPLKHWNGVSWV